MLPLSRREQQIFDTYKEAITSKQKLPTMREIGASLGISYTAVNTYTKRIIEKGYLIRKSQNVLVLANQE